MVPALALGLVRVLRLAWHLVAEVAAMRDAAAAKVPVLVPVLALGLGPVLLLQVLLVLAVVVAVVIADMFAFHNILHFRCGVEQSPSSNPLDHPAV